MRRAALALALAVTAVASPADARACPMLTDPEDYQRVLGHDVIDGHLDIRSADLASNDTVVLAVLRMRSLGPGEPSGVAGVRWSFVWEIDGTLHVAEVRRAAGPTATYTASFGAAPVSATIDAATASITWRIPRSAIPALATPKRTFRNLRATTSVAGSTFDTAASMATYIDQTAGCIPAS